MVYTLGQRNAAPARHPCNQHGQYNEHDQIGEARAKSPGQRNKPLPAAARQQSGGLVSLGRRGAAAARQQNRPILLSIGYAACHWCHVMAHESFEDQATAAFMNAHFVNIKVDREERPDLDSIYMQAVTAMTGRGGWPMTVFLRPMAGRSTAAPTGPTSRATACPASCRCCAASPTPGQRVRQMCRPAPRKCCPLAGADDPDQC